MLRSDRLLAQARTLRIGRALRAKGEPVPPAIAQAFWTDECAAAAWIIEQLSAPDHPDVGMPMRENAQPSVGLDGKLRRAPVRRSTKVVDVGVGYEFKQRIRDLIVAEIDAALPQKAIADAIFAKAVEIGNVATNGAVSRTRRSASDDVAMLIIEAALIEAVHAVIVINDSRRPTRPDALGISDRRAASRMQRRRKDAGGDAVLASRTSSPSFQKPRE